MRKRTRIGVVLALGAAFTLSAAASTGADSGPIAGVCLGDLTAAGVAQQPGRHLRFGITPAGEAGAAGPPVPVVPVRRGPTLRALAELRAGGRPFVLRLNRFFWSEGAAGIERFLQLAHRYTRLGYLVELQVRYHPAAGREGDVAGFVRFVRKVVRRFGPDRRVIGIQVANEVNFYPIAPDASDAGYAGAKDALIQGVIAAKQEARRGGFHQLKVGFNWAYRTDPGNEDSFWSYLRDHGGPHFVAALDWVGLDAYPGTVFPTVEPPGGTGDGIVNAMSQLRKCFMPKAGIPRRVPIHVEENGWPTGPGRSDAQQETELRSMVGAVHDLRGTYNVTDYRWFDLRDHDTSSANFQHHYGLMTDDYTPKPAFAAYRELVRALGR